MSHIYRKSGGFRKLHSFNFATIVHLGTMSFCKRFIDWKQDPLGKTLGQMVGASRSGKQNIIEGSERAKTSAETEIKLTDVAKGSLAELMGDLEDYLAVAVRSPGVFMTPSIKGFPPSPLTLSFIRMMCCTTTGCICCVRRRSSTGGSNTRTQPSSPMP